jgi:hypothetical protein
MLTHQTPRGFTVPPNQPSTLVDRDAPDLELEIIEKLLPLLADRAFSLFDLADIAGLPFSQLADLLESERVDKAYRAMLRILAIRQKFIDAQSHFVTTSQLLSIASAQPLDAKEADQSRKAANKLETLRRSSPVAERGGGGGGRHSLTEVEVYASPSPAPAGEVSASSPVLPPLPPPAGEGRGEGSCPSGPTSQPSSPHAHDEIVGFPAPTLASQLHTACGSCRSWRNTLRAPTHDTQTSQCS